MSARAAKWLLLTAALALCCACGIGRASSSGDEPPATPTLYFGETQLHWQVPSNDYRIMGMLSDEDGFAVLYEEQRRWGDDPKSKPKLEVMVQLFNAQGHHAWTAYTGIWRESHYPLGDIAFRLAHDGLYLTYGQRTDYGIDRVTGVASQWRYAPLLRENGITLSYSSVHSDQHDTVVMRYRFEIDNGNLYELIVPEFDHIFAMALGFLARPEYTDREGLTYVATAQIDADAKTAVISNTKLTYELDFDNLSYTCTRRYTDEMLDTALATSPDKNTMLYTADSGGAGDAFWMDIVLKARDGRIVFLDTDAIPYGADFFDNNTVVLNHVTSLKAFDIATGQPEGRPLLDLGTTTDAGGRERPARLVVGMAIDRENRLLLAAVRDYTEDWDALMPVTLVLFDAALTPIAELETDLRIRPYRNNWTMRCDIALNGDGTATLSWDYMQDAPVQVRYLP